MQYLKGVPLLILANKQDLPNAMSTEEIIGQLKLDEYRLTVWDRKWGKYLYSFTCNVNMLIQAFH